MTEIGFLIFWFFLLFFSEFSSSGRVWTEFGTKIFFLSFSAYLLPFWLKIILKRDFLIFLIIFFGIFLPGSSINGIRNYNFFFSFSASFNPFWIEIMSELTFFIFWIFLQFFLEFSCPGRVWTEFGTKIFFSFSQLISSRFG